MSKTTVIRLKSDNFDTYVSKQAYEEIILQMSSGDFGSHKAREVQVDANTLEKMRWSSKLGFVDFFGEDDLFSDSLGCHWYYYDGAGDCEIQPV